MLEKNYKQLVRRKLRVFEYFARKQNKIFNYVLTSRFWERFKAKRIRKAYLLLEDFEEDNIDPRNTTLTLIMAQSKLLNIPGTFLALAALGLLAHYFPLEITDFLYEWFFFFLYNPLILLLLSPLVSIFPLIVLNDDFKNEREMFHLYVYFFLFFLALFIFARFDLSSEEFQFQYRFKWGYADYTYDFVVGLDNASVLLVLLTAFIFLLTAVLNYNSKYKYLPSLSVSFLILFFFIILAFVSLDIIIFYFAFEAVLLPMFLIIGVWGSRERKIYAAYKFFFYTFIGSVTAFIGIVVLIVTVGNGDISYITEVFFTQSFQKLIFVLFFLSFAVKVPLVPFHLWLPEAHVEAPTSGSIVLAAILLKLGTYGMLRYLVPIFPYAASFYQPAIILLCIVAVLYASIIAFRQIDFKKIIAYSSVAHMGFVVLGLFLVNVDALTGAYFIMLSHGLVSTILFALIGVLYDRFKTRLLYYYQGLTTTMPIFSTVFLLATLSNIAFPGTASFFGEFSIFLSLCYENFFVFGCVIQSVVLSVVYSLWLFNRVCFGHLNLHLTILHQDLNLLEFIVLFALTFLVIVFGLFPQALTEYLDYFVNELFAILLMK